MLTEVRKKKKYKKNYNVVKTSEITTFRVVTILKIVVTEKIIIPELPYNYKKKSFTICLIIFHPSNFVQSV